MHKQDFGLDLKNISKIEGHTHLEVKVRDGKVVLCQLKIAESKRFFSNAAVGLKFDVLPITMSRICGTCSSAHALCSIEALEKALGVDGKVSEQTKRLRDLLVCSNHLRDHAMHLYFFCLPDVFGFDSVLDFPESKDSWIHDGLAVKEAGNFVSTIVGGRAVHPPNAVFGGFSKFPSAEEIDDAIVKLEDCRERILKVADIFYKDKTAFVRKTNYVGLVSDGYSFLKGHIEDTDGLRIEEEGYGEHFEKVVLPYATARGVLWKDGTPLDSHGHQTGQEGGEFMVGALARLNLNRGNLNKRTRRDVAKYLGDFPCDDVFNNNLAQAIEMLQCVDVSLDIFRNFKWVGIKAEKPVRGVPNPKGSVGVGVMEAPRGTLYYKLALDGKGVVQAVELCIPTQQNIIHLEKDIASYVEHMLKKGFDKKKISYEVEKMIRAYDPCMSCATHFLKIDWE